MCGPGCDENGMFNCQRCGALVATLGCYHNTNDLFVCTECENTADDWKGESMIIYILIWALHDEADEQRAVFLQKHAAIDKFNEVQTMTGGYAVIHEHKLYAASATIAEKRVNAEGEKE